MQQEVAITQGSRSPFLFGLTDFPEAIIGCGRGGREGKEIHDSLAVAHLKLNLEASTTSYPQPARFDSTPVSIYGRSAEK